jgi:hydroxymethylpyrimidine/phosphomethylpyrimidine kinase
MRGRVLVVAGSDSGAGAGIQADIKTVAALGGYATTAVTALTVQDTKGVHGVFAVPPAFLRAQMEVVLADIGTDAFKSGMLADEATMETVADVIGRHRTHPFVLDPVMIAKGGHRLLAEGAVGCLKRVLLPLATLITPNVPEAESLAGRAIRTRADQIDVARQLLGLGAGAVLLKGAHMEGAEIADVLATADGTAVFVAARIDTRHTHGTGCTLASAIAVSLAQGFALAPAIARARAYVREAIAQAPGFGGGHGPLNHSATAVAEWASEPDARA